MTYNIWIFLSAVLGAGFGYFALSENHSYVVEKEDDARDKI
ncbi:hypothetical protein B4U80_02701 [Leptotrombidium deliense]|uniref:Uncharacterized protein n=1 Tax=Leptotrombidium deliense TaxID=299467 RepID=A0A443RW66_9ACAR|nr:hypothetical protein B4U80_02701 [Leptotrombidium deliense]